MKKTWKILGILLVFLAFIGAASAQWQQNSSEQMDTDEVAQQAKELLDKAEIEEFQGYRTDIVHYRIVSDGEYVGVLWEDVSLDDLTLGEPYNARWGTKVPLLYNDETVGQLFVDGTPGGQGWQNNSGGYCCGAANADGQARSQGQGPYGHGQCDGTGQKIGNAGNARGHGGFRG
ncbi:MAG: hypothetical protein R6U44_01095 [Archaeoglobaceae archaeon]